MDVVEKWMVSGVDEVAMVLVSSVATYSLILLYTRICGLRSFSKMSAADFAMTVAVGSLFASTISSPNPTLLLGAVSLGALFAGQYALAILRKRSKWLGTVVDNQPLLLMAGAEILDDNLAKANVTRSDVFAKLRESNTYSYDQVLAVVFETTGDISVLHAADETDRIHPDFVKDVIDADRVMDCLQNPTSE
ncbi:MAG: DUF421 domain-containing protein [Fuerstiella sp.]